MAFYRTITIDKTRCGSADSTDFPLLFAGTYSWLATTANSGKVQSASGFDIVPYADSALTTKLAFERVTWNASTGAIELWIKLPTLSVASNAVFYLGYGSASITTDQANVTGTWSNGFARTFHFDDDPTGTAPQLRDSAANAAVLTGTNEGSGGSATRSTGQVGRDLLLTPTSEYNYRYFATSAASGMGTGSSSLSGWIYRNSDDHSGYDNDQFLFGRIGGSYPNAYFTFLLLKGGGFALQAGSEGEYVAYYSTALGTNAWHHLAASIDTSAGTVKAYLDGTLVVNQSFYRSLRDDLMRIGGSCLTSYDEVQASSVARSGDWFLAQYNNQNSPSTFYTIGSESSAGGVAYTRSWTDSITLADSRTRLVTRPRFDSVALLDSRLFSISRSRMDVVTVIDAAAKSSSRVRLDSLSISDALTAVRSRVLSFLDSVSVAESFQSTRLRLFGLLDSLAISDSIRRAAGTIKSDWLSLADSAAKLVTQAAHLDGVMLFDATSWQRIRLLTFVDSLVVTDKVSRFVARLRADAVSLLDSLSTVRLGVVATSLGTTHVFKVRAQQRIWIVMPAMRRWLVDERNVLVTTIKDPLALEDFQFDWTAEIGTADSIAASAWTLQTGLTADNPNGSVTGKTTQIRLGGGTIGKTYAATNQITLASGQRKARSLHITIDRQ